MNSAIITSNMPIPAATGSLDSYITSVNRIPVLQVEEERELAERYRNNEDLEAARRLIMAHLRFVVHVARGYSGYGLPIGDLIQEGNIGLMKAVKRFDPSHKVRLVSFAVHWIRAEMHEFILRNWRIVKVATTKSQRKLFFNLRKSKKRLGWLNKSEVDAVAEDLGVSPEVVLEMESRLSGQDIGYDAPTDDPEESRPAPMHFLRGGEDPSAMTEADDWESHNNGRLYSGLGELDPRSQDIIKRRWLQEKKTTLQVLATEYGISAERIRQLEANALKRMRGMLAA